MDGDARSVLGNVHTCLHLTTGRTHDSITPLRRQEGWDGARRSRGSPLLTGDDGREHLVTHLATSLAILEASLVPCLT